MHGVWQSDDSDICGNLWVLEAPWKYLRADFPVYFRGWLQARLAGLAAQPRRPVWPVAAHLLALCKEEAFLKVYQSQKHSHLRIEAGLHSTWLSQDAKVFG